MNIGANDTDQRPLLIAEIGNVGADDEAKRLSGARSETQHTHAVTSS